MIDLLKKTAFMGLGVAAMTKDKVEDIAKDFIAKGAITEQEGEKFVEEILQKSTKVQNDLSLMLDAKVHQALEKVDLVKKSEYEDLVEQVAVLRGELADIKEKACACPPEEG